MKQRGIALISAVIMMTLAMMLLGAFLQVNRAHVWLLNSSEGRQTAHSACQAAFEYVMFRLEHDRKWSEVAFTGRLDGDGTDLEVEEVKDSRTIRGYLKPMDATFEADIENNLSNSAMSEFGVPPYMCRLTIRGTAMGVTKEVVTLLHQAPLFDSSALTRGKMVMNSDQFNVRSKDKWRNQIRAEENIDIPSAAQARTQFLLPDSAVQDSKGMMWSKSDIISGGTKLDASNINDANLNSGGRFVPKSKQHFEIFDLKSDSIVTPKSNLTAVKPGVYRFTKATAHLTIDAQYGTGWGAESHQITRDQEIEVLEYYEHPDDPLPKHVYRSQNRLDDVQPPVPKDTGGWFPKGLAGADISKVDVTYKNEGTQNVPVTLGDTVFLDEDSGKKVMADLLTQKVTIAPGTAVEVDGSLSIESLRGKPPLLDLGAETERAAILAKGSLNLSRTVTQGVGTLVSREGDVSLAPLGENFEVESSNPLFGGLVLFAGRDVNLINPSEEPGGKWDFKGLVYARNNFTFNANQADATVEGTVVARNGNLTFESPGADVEFIYNPEYLKKMLEDLPDNRLQLERIYWRE